MAKLPFVVQPRLKPIIEIVGTEESGKIEIERRGFLSVAEKSMCQGMLEDSKGVNAVQAIARRIANGLAIDLVEALELVGKVLQGEKVEYDLDSYLDDLNEAALDMMESLEKQALARALTLIISRIDPEFGVEDMQQLHPELVEALSALYADEEAKSVEALEAAIEKRPGGRKVATEEEAAQEGK